MHQQTDQQADSLTLTNYSKQEPGTITQIRDQILKSRKVLVFQFSPTVLPPVGWFAHRALAYPSEHSQLAGARN